MGFQDYKGNDDQSDLREIHSVTANNKQKVVNSSCSFFLKFTDFLQANQFSYSLYTKQMFSNSIQSRCLCPRDGQTPLF